MKKYLTLILFFCASIVFAKAEEMGEGLEAAEKNANMAVTTAKYVTTFMKDGKVIHTQAHDEHETTVHFNHEQMTAEQAMTHSKKLLDTEHAQMHGKEKGTTTLFSFSKAFKKVTGVVKKVAPTAIKIGIADEPAVIGLAGAAGV